MFYREMWLALCILLNIHIAYSAVLPAECSLKESGVYVSISSNGELVDGIISRWIDLQWWGKKDLEIDDAIGLWNHDPLLDPSDPLFMHAGLNSSDGYVRTTVRWNNTAFPKDLNDTPKCLPLWAGFVKEEVIESSCLELHPHWMEEHKADLEDGRIAEVMIPGIHDAGAYGLLPDGDMGKWVITQDENFLQQLILGARYLDIRIGYYPKTEEKLFIVHGSVSVRPLQSYLDDVAFFVSSTEEIVIFDIHLLEHGFSGLTYDEDALPSLIKALEETFNGLMLPNFYAPNPKLSEIWQSGRQLIVTLPEETESPWFWPRVNHIWGDVNNLEDLYSYLSVNIPLYVSNQTMSSAMAEFTPTALDISKNHWGGLRGAAAETNFPVTFWLRNEWWLDVNIIAMDFIASSDIIRIVIEGNMVRKQCGKDEYLHLR